MRGLGLYHMYVCIPYVCSGSHVCVCVQRGQRTTSSNVRQCFRCGDIVWERASHWNPGLTHEAARILSLPPQCWDRLALLWVKGHELSFLRLHGKHLTCWVVGPALESEVFTFVVESVKGVREIPVRTSSPDLYVECTCGIPPLSLPVPRVSATRGRYSPCCPQQLSSETLFALCPFPLQGQPSPGPWSSLRTLSLDPFPLSLGAPKQEPLKSWRCLQEQQSLFSQQMHNSEEASGWKPCSHVPVCLLQCCVLTWVFLSVIW